MDAFAVLVAVLANLIVSFIFNPCRRICEAVQDVGMFIFNACWLYYNIIKASLEYVVGCDDIHEEVRTLFVRLWWSNSMNMAVRSMQHNVGRSCYGYTLLRRLQDLLFQPDQDRNPSTFHISTWIWAQQRDRVRRPRAIAMSRP